MVNENMSNEEVLEEIRKDCPTGAYSNWGTEKDINLTYNKYGNYILIPPKLMKII